VREKLRKKRGRKGVSSQIVKSDERMGGKAALSDAAAETALGSTCQHWERSVEDRIISPQLEPTLLHKRDEKKTSAILSSRTILVNTTMASNLGKK